MAGMCHLTPAEMVMNGIVRPLGFNPLWVPAVQLANVVDQIAYYSRLNLLLNQWDTPVGAPGAGVFGLPITDVEKAPYRIFYKGEIDMLQKLLASIMTWHVAVAGAPGVPGFEPKPSNFQKLTLYDGEGDVKLAWWRPLVEEHI
jgi:hypothetical protein